MFDKQFTHLWLMTATLGDPFAADSHLNFSMLSVTRARPVFERLPGQVQKIVQDLKAAAEVEKPKVDELSAMIRARYAAMEQIRDEIPEGLTLGPVRVNCLELREHLLGIHKKVRAAALARTAAVPSTCFQSAKAS